jgi:alpha-beta hydrolase superfamily lysophospholipase
MPQHLSRDPSVGEAYVKDPLVHPYLTPRFLVEFLNMLSFVHSHAGDLHLPTLILCPTDDRIVNPQGSIDFFNAVTNPQKKLITYAGYYHEIFSEIGKERVFADMEAWMEKVT